MIRLARSDSSLWARRKIFVHTEENFLTYENIFSYVRKFFFLRKKISPPSNVDFSPSAERQIFVRTEENFLPQENLFPCGRKNIFLRKEIWASSERKFCALRKAKNFLPKGKKFPHMRKYFFLYTEINFLIYGNFPPYIQRFFALPKQGRSEARGRGIFPPERDEKEGAPSSGGESRRASYFRAARAAS